MLSAATGFRAELMSLKSASIPASAMRKTSPSEPNELISESKFWTTISVLPPRKLKVSASIRTRSRQFGPISMPAISSAMTPGIWKRRSRSGQRVMMAMKTMNRIRNVSLLKRHLRQ